MANEKVVSIVVTYNGSEWIDDCFDSQLFSTIPVKIIAIDNASTDGTPDIIRQKFPSVEIIENKKNLGFGKANNIGIKKALEYGAEYILLLNQDAAIIPGTLGKLIKIFESEAGYGVLSPFHLYSDFQIENSFLNYLNKENTPDLINDSLTGNMQEVYNTLYVNAAIWLISKRCLLKVGGFAPIFPHYGEDNNFIHRCEYHKIKVGIVPGAKGYHLRDQNSYSWPFRKRLYREYIGMLIDIMNPNQSYFKAFKRTINGLLLNSGINSLLINILILLIIIPRVVMIFPLIHKQKVLSRHSSSFTLNK
jgi:GT2 family glycosyltransferase